MITKMINRYIRNDRQKSDKDDKMIVVRRSMIPGMRIIAIMIIKSSDE